jgi:hypothetical protein
MNRNTKRGPSAKTVELNRLCSFFTFQQANSGRFCSLRGNLSSRQHTCKRNENMYESTDQKMGLYRPPQHVKYVSCLEFSEKKTGTTYRFFRKGDYLCFWATE